MSSEGYIDEHMHALGYTFGMRAGLYDVPYGAQYAVWANFSRITKLAEYDEIVVDLGRNWSEAAHLEKLYQTKYAHAEQAALDVIEQRNYVRIDAALANNDHLPTDDERYRGYAAALFGVAANATWPELAEAREWYRAVKWAFSAGMCEVDGITMREALLRQDRTGSVLAEHLDNTQKFFYRRIWQRIMQSMGPARAKRSKTIPN